MRRWLAVMAIVLAGCIDSSRVNKTCTWSDAVSGPLDLDKGRGREHLRQDAEIANELMVQFGDAHFYHRPDLQRPYREQCMRAMTDSIMARHGVTREQIAVAERDRPWWADFLLVFLPMAVIGAAGMDLVTRRVRAGFDAEDSPIATAIVVVLVFMVAGLTLGVANWWSFAVEGWRLRSGHVSNRAFFIPVVTHAWIAYFVALAVCGLAATRRLRR